MWTLKPQGLSESNRLILRAMEATSDIALIVHKNTTLRPQCFSTPGLRVRPKGPTGNSLPFHLVIGTPLLRLLLVLYISLYTGLQYHYVHINYYVNYMIIDLSLTRYWIKDFLPVTRIPWVSSHALFFPPINLSNFLNGFTLEHIILQIPFYFQFEFNPC